MTRFFHLLGFELRRMRWFALWIVGLLLTELAIRAWLVFGPVGANWPEPPVPFLWMAILLMLSLVVATITLFLDNNNAGTRSPALTQAIPRALIAGTKLTTLGVLLGLIWATMILVRVIHHSDTGWEGSLAFGWQLLPLVAWVAVQAESPAGMLKQAAFWCALVWVYSLFLIAFFQGAWIERVRHGVDTEWLLQPWIPFLAIPVIAWHYVPRRSWLKLVVNLAAFFIAFHAPHWLVLAAVPLETRDLPPSPSQTTGQATILDWDPGSKRLRMRLEPGLLQLEEFPVLASVTESARTWWANDSVRVLPTEALPPTSHEEPPNEENRAIVDAVFPMDGPKSIVGGEAVVFLYRLDPIPGVLKPGQDRIDYKSSGRNAAITRDGPHMRWRGTGFRWSGADAQRRDWLHPGPDLVRVSEPGAAPLLEAVTIVEDFDNEGFGKGYLHFDHQFRRAQFEFFEERFVRVIRVKLVPGSTTPVP